MTSDRSVPAPSSADNTEAASEAGGPFAGDHVLNASLRNAGVGIAVLSLDGRILLANEACEDITGYPECELVALGWEKLFHPEDVERIRAMVRQTILDRGERYSHENRCLRKDGEVIWISAKGTVFRGGPGGLQSIVCVLQDITELKRNEAELRESEARFRTISEIGSDWFWELDANLRLRFLSDTYTENTGVPRDALIGGGAGEILRGVDDPAVMAGFLGDLDRRAEIRELTFRQTLMNGAVIWMSVSGRPIHDDGGEFAGYRGTGTDITKQKTAEDTLRESEWNLRHVASLAKIGYFIWDGVRRRSVAVSEDFARMHGVAPEEYVAYTSSHEAFLSWLHPDDRARYEQETASAAAERRGLDIEYRVVARDGVLRHVHEIRDSTYDEDGAPLNSTGSLQDITGQREAEATLRENEAQLRRVVALTKVGYFEWDGVNRRMTACSEELAAIHGVTREECLETMNSFEGVLSWIHPDDRAHYERESEEMRARRIRLDIEYRILSRDGAVRHVREVTDGRYDDSGNLLTSSGSIQDLTAIRTAERALSETENKLEQLLQFTNQGCWWIDNDARTLDVNPAMCEILGLPRNEIVGREIYDFVDAENAAVFRAEMLLRKNGERGSYEISLRRPDGSLVPCVNHATPIHDARGSKIASIGLWTDLSKIKESEKRLRSTMRELEKASRAKSEFLSSVSHELRTPLNAVIGVASLLESDQDQPLTEDQLEKVSLIARSGRLLLDLITQILDLARIESGKIDLSMTTVGASEPLADCVAMTRTLAAARNIDLVDNVSNADLPRITTDVMRFKQVVLNLLTNAVKYTPDSGRVSVEAGVAKGGLLRVSVADTGPGIPENDLAVIFEPFNRLGREASDIQGAGIGLTIAKQLIELLGGEIRVESKPGEGSAFTVTVPVSDHRVGEIPSPGPPRARSHPDRPETHEGKRRKVLYVEDNPINAQLMRYMFKMAPNMDLIDASDAETGLDLARAERPDLILMDIQLPGMNGFDALRSLRDSADTLHIPVIAVSAAAMKDDIRNARDAGFDAYITKPIQLRETLEIIRNTLEA